MVFLLAIIEDSEKQSYLEELYLDYRKMCYYIVMGIVKNHQDTEDTVQQIFINIAEFLVRKKDVKIKNKKAFISVIAHNLACNHAKAKKQHENIDEFEELENVTFIDPEINVLRMDQIKEHTNYLEQVNKDYIYIIMLKYEEELSISEIASTLNITEECAKKRLTRAKKALKNILKENEKYA